MKLIRELEELQPEMQKWRRDIHAHPEIAFEEHRTSKIIIEKLKSFGIEVDSGVAGTGVTHQGRGKGAVQARQQDAAVDHRGAGG